MSKTVTLTIDGKQVTVPEGTLIVDAAKKIGVDIPVFCYHPKMQPVGMCRMCLVEVGRPVVDRATGQVVKNEDGTPQIRFAPNLMTACTTPVSEGMVVLTESEKAHDGHRAIIEFLLTSHPLDCPICDKGGECPLQELTMRHGPPQGRFPYEDKIHFEKHFPLGELIYLDRERCILCGRCIRYQAEIVGEPVIGFYQRGRATEIVTYSDPGFDSYFSGNTTDICPVGALTTADFRFGARAWELKAEASICAQCPVGCNIVFNTRREAKSGGRVVIKRVMPRQNEEVNELWICDKGRFVHHYTHSAERLSRPLMRKGETLQPVSWEDALRTAAEKFEAAGKEVLVLASGRLSNEDLFNLKALADGLGGRAVLYGDMGGGDLTTLVGVGQGTNLATLGAGDAILVIASDLQEEAPIWWLRVKQAAERGATLIVANPRATKLDTYASFVIRYANGDEVQTVLNLAKKTDKIGQAFAEAENAVVFFGSEGLGLEGSQRLAVACAHLLRETGHVGKPNNGLIGVWQRANDQGAWELGFEPVADLQAAFEQAGAVYIVGADPFGDGRLTLDGVKERPFLVVQEILPTPTTEVADLVLPAQAYAEREGTYVSGERRVQRFYAALPPYGEARPDFAITAAIGKRLGLDLEDGSAEKVFERLAVTQPAFENLTYARLAEVREQWPIVGRGDLYYGGTAYENRRGLGVQLVPAAQREEPVTLPEVQGEAGPRPEEDEWLGVPVTRLLDRGTTVLLSTLLHRRIGEPFVVVHPMAAERLSLAEGQKARLTVNGASAEVTVRVDETVSAGVVLVPRSMGLPLYEPMKVSLKAL
ncbi:MAG: NADH dehydrogenase (quinone) subunit G [Anaerolineae bacterium]|nr:MAG: NADH dehydrogenase (quinone) subunit G [Anaerolineae bacterium]